MSFIGERYYYVTDHNTKIIELEVISEESIGSDNYGTKDEPKMVEWFEVKLKNITPIDENDNVLYNAVESVSTRYFSRDNDDRNGLHRTFDDAKYRMVSNLEYKISNIKNELTNLEKSLKLAQKM